MLQNPRKTLGFKKNMVYEIPPGGGGKPYPASGLYGKSCISSYSKKIIIFLCVRTNKKYFPEKRHCAN